VTPFPGTTDPSLERSIKEEARRLGFVLAGVTNPEPPPHAAVFDTWLNEGRHGAMGYLAEPRSRLCRTDPRKLMPECKSILALAVAYPKPAPGPMADDNEGGQRKGRVAAYAWGRDYHKVLPGRLQAIVTFIERQVGHPVRSRSYTDTGPILERDLAQRAGLGWIGKNTCLINPGLGSYFLLAEILLDIALKPDEPLRTDHCGTCTRCIDACPTSCILPDRTIDANECISYLTIELRTPIPGSLRAKMGDWVFGCDVCQWVCPWNRFAAPAGDAALVSQATSGSRNLQQDLLLDEIQFHREFKDSAISRAKHSGYLRNLAVVAGNTAGTEILPVLQSLSAGGPPLVKEHADWAIQNIAERRESNA
jgi:epoxyqueuosine reductase